MTPDPSSALQALQEALRSVRQRDRAAARRWAERAVTLDPALEEAWLILAAVASPRASVAYLEKALEINPGSERARQGLEWARNRLGRQQPKAAPLADTAPHPAQPAAPQPKPARPPAQPVGMGVRLRRQVKVAPSLASPGPSPTRLQARYRLSFLVLAGLLLCAAGAAAFGPGNTSPALAFLRKPQSLEVAGAPPDLSKPSYTPTFTATFTPTPTASNTFTPTATYTPTDTPTPTFTFTPTDTPWPTATPFLPATEQPYPTAGGGGGVKWIDVDLSDQMLYAYEGNTIVASFLVSTGVPAFPTVVGQFRIYLKFEYTLMAGDGYYLPDVPYTMYFYRGYGIHGTYWHSNFGTPMSHGCVNMYTPDAQWLYYWAPMGTLVNIHY